MDTFHTPARHRIDGVAFAVPELILLTAWADFHAFSLRIELDWQVDQVAYEEVVTLRLFGSPIPHWLMWRTANSVVLQPMVGRARRFACITDLLGAICSEQR